VSRRGAFFARRTIGLSPATGVDGAAAMYLVALGARGERIEHGAAEVISRDPLAMASAAST